MTARLKLITALQEAADELERRGIQVNAWKRRDKREPERREKEAAEDALMLFVRRHFRKQEKLIKERAGHIVPTVKHLPGEHDQMTHGHGGHGDGGGGGDAGEGGGSAARVISGNKEVAEVLADSYEKEYGWDREHTREKFIANQMEQLKDAPVPSPEFVKNIEDAVREAGELGVSFDVPVVVHGERPGYNDHYTNAEYSRTHIKVVYHEGEEIKVKTETLGKSVTRIPDTYDNPMTGTLIHEAGHALDYKSGEKLSSNASTYLDTKEQRNFVKENISYYAKTNGAELVAESFAAKHHPDYDTLPDEAKELIDNVLLGK